MYQLTMADIKSVTDKEFNSGTTRCFPLIKDIPRQFYYPGNIYNKVADAIYIGEIPQGTVVINPGFEDAQLDPNGMTKFIMAHIRSNKHEYEVKIASIAYMLSIIATITE